MKTDVRFHFPRGESEGCYAPRKPPLHERAAPGITDLNEGDNGLVYRKVFGENVEGGYYWVVDGSKKTTFSATFPKPGNLTRNEDGTPIIILYKGDELGLTVKIGKKISDYISLHEENENGELTELKDYFGSNYEAYTFKMGKDFTFEEVGEHKIHFGAGSGANLVRSDNYYTFYYKDSYATEFSGVTEALGTLNVGDKFNITGRLQDELTGIYEIYYGEDDANNKELSINFYLDSVAEENLLGSVKTKFDGIYSDETGKFDSGEIEITEDKFTPGEHKIIVAVESNKFTATSVEVPLTVQGASSAPVYYSDPTYRITAETEDAGNGTFTVNKKYASSGEAVTITAAPDRGFTVETITVTGKNGKEIEVKNLGDNKFSFRMPASAVTVSATFMEDNTMLNFCVDVKASDYYYDPVLWVYTNGVCKGVDATHFGPDYNTTRAQVATFLWRAAGCPEPKGDASKFVDVPANEYYAKAVAWAIEQGITKGTSATAFEPEAVCTRGQITTFLARYAGVKDAETESAFADVKAADYFAAAVKWATDNGVTEGTTTTTFSPDDKCTRVQTATFLYRWMAK